MGLAGRNNWLCQALRKRQQGRITVQDANDLQGFSFDDEQVAEITRDFQNKEDEILSMPNVVGVGVGNKVSGGKDTEESCIKILVSQKLPPELLGSGEAVSDQIGGTRTDVEEVGHLFAGGADQTAVAEADSPADEISTFIDAEAGIQLLRTRVRPAKGGYSVGHYRITAGTIATCVYDSSPYPGIPPRYYILSNNHVLANSNSARLGDPILQPGPADG